MSWITIRHRVAERLWNDSGVVEGADEIVASDRGFPALDAVRAIGALMVVLTHCAFNTGEIDHGLIGAVLSRFDVGVALFFVLSGFLLSRPVLMARAMGRPHPSVPHYLWKRALRILPLYWLVVVAVLLADSANRPYTWHQWLSELTLSQLYLAAPLASSLTQMWSLCTEVLFYLLLPLLVPVLMGRSGYSLRRILTRASVLAVLGLAWVPSANRLAPSHHPGQWLPGYLPWFLVGVAFAAVGVNDRVTGRPSRCDRAAADVAGWWVLAGALFAIACSDVAGPRLLLPASALEGVVKCVLYGASAGCLVFPLVFGDELAGAGRTFLVGRLPSRLGEVSYGIFCLHMFVLVVGMRVAHVPVFTGRFWLVTPAVLLVTTGLAALSYRFLEAPLLRLKNRGPFAPRISASAPAATAAHATTAQH